MLLIQVVVGVTVLRHDCRGVIDMAALKLIQCVTIFLLSLEIVYIFFRLRTRHHAYLLIYCLSVLVNNVGYLFEMLATDSESALRGTQIAYLGKVWVVLIFFIFTLEFCKIELPRIIYAMLATIHMFIFLLVLAARYTPLYYTNYTFVTEGVFPHNVYGHGIFYFVFIFLLIVYMVVGFTVIVRTIMREKRKRTRGILYYLFATAFAEGIGVFIFLTGVTKGYDITALSYAISTVFMYIAFFKYNMMNTLDLVKDCVMDNLTEGILAVDSGGEVVYYNEPFFHLYPLIETDGKNILQEITNCIQHNDVLKIKDAVYRPETQLLFSEGKLKGNIYMLLDETEQHRYMQELKEQKVLAEEANASKSAFLSIVSHEIRTPMNAVVGMTDLLLQEELTEKQRKYMTNIKNSGTALVMLINDILDQSKIEAGKMEIVNDIYELRPMVEDVEMIIENRIGNKPIHLLVQIDEKLPKLMIGDALRLRQIFINLMNNSVKYTESGFILFSAKILQEDEDNYLIRFGVKDSGQGIKEEDLSRLGKRFAQVDTKRNHSKGGTGLGLSISSDFIGLMGGQLMIESTYGKGSEFYFSIRQGKVSNGGENGEYRKYAWKPEYFMTKNARALVVDDTEINLILMEEILKSFHMTVETADSGEKAMELVEQKEYDVIFMDYIMPVMDGVITTDRIRKLSQAQQEENKAAYYKNIPIIALTGDISERTQEMFHVAGINDFIEKPVSIEKLSRSLNRWLPEELIEN